MKKQFLICWSVRVVEHIWMGLTTFGRYDIEDTVDFTVYIPKTDPLLQHHLQ